MFNRANIKVVSTRERKWPMKIICFMLLVLPIIAFSTSLPAEVETKILKKYKLEIPEMSGMCWRTIDNKRELVIVSDQNNNIYLVTLDSNGPKIKLIVDLTPILGKHFKGLQWESIYSDSSGKLFLLQENPMRIVVLDKNLRKIERVIGLENTPGANINKKSVNSMGEGILLLNNGHILISKEKDPFFLIEYGPSKENAFGYEASSSLEYGGAFPFADSKTYIPHHYWKLNKSDSKKVEDVSGVNLDKEGNMYLLSDKSNLIAYVGDNLSVSKENRYLTIQKIFKLPDVIKKAEGMVIDAQRRPIIVTDSKNKDDFNFFILEELSLP